MCGQFIMVPKEVVEEIIRDIMLKRLANAMPDYPMQRKTVYPKAEVAVIVPENSHLEAVDMQWGYSVSWNKGVLFNTRFDTALKPGHNMWAESLAHRRCIVPTFGFFESHKTETSINPRSGKENKQQYAFSAPNSTLTFIGGIFEKNQFSIMTTEPNDAVRPIHDRMPVVLMPDELETWLHGNYLALKNRDSVALTAKKQ